MERWELDLAGVRSRMYLAPDASGERTVACSVAPVAGTDRLGHRPGPGPGCSHHRQMGHRLQRGRSGGPDLRSIRWFPPVLGEEQQAELKAAVQKTPATAGIAQANWNWKVVRQFVSERFAVSLSRSTCLDYQHRLGFAFKRPKKRLLKADAEKREAFVAEYAALAFQAQESGEKIFFADEAHFRADAELRGKWVLRGESALVDSSSPRYGEKANYYSAVCLESGEVEWMELEGNSNSETSAAFLEQLRERHSGRLNVIWDNAPAHRGEAVREWLGKPGVNLRLVSLPGYSPDFNADEAIWGWARKEATGNMCLGTKKLVQEKVGNFLDGLAGRKEEVKRRCRTILQSRAEGLLRNPHTDPHHRTYAHPTLALV